MPVKTSSKIKGRPDQFVEVGEAEEVVSGQIRSGLDRTTSTNVRWKRGSLVDHLAVTPVVKGFCANLRHDHSTCS